MSGRRRLMVLVAVLAGVMASQQSYAQFGGGFDPAAMRARVLQQYKDDIGFTDEEWGVIEPKLWRVVGLQVETGTGNLGGMARLVRGFGRGRGGPNGSPDMNAYVNQIISQLFFNGRPSVVMTKRQELEAAVNDNNTTPQQFAVKLEEYRVALNKSRTELQQAQADLRGVLTIRQEAALMDAGFLD